MIEVNCPYCDWDIETELLPGEMSIELQCPHCKGCFILEKIYQVRKLPE